jgi:hypothetical protein
MHTTASRGTRIEYDSVIGPKQAIDILSKSGVNAAVVTDHDTTRAYDLMKSYGKSKGVYVIRGIEITSSEGHILGLGVEEGIDKKLNGAQNRLTALETADLIRDFCGEVYIPHPFDIEKKGVGMKILEIDGMVEVFNPMNIFGFENALADKVASKLGKPKVVGADAHMQSSLNMCLTCVDSELNEDSILRSLKKGRVKFENCKYMHLMDFKELVLSRMQFSYQDIMQKINDGWDIDSWYMNYANNCAMKKIEKGMLKLGVRKPDAGIWDSMTQIAYVVAMKYAKRVKKEYSKSMRAERLFL